MLTHIINATKIRNDYMMGRIVKTLDIKIKEMFQCNYKMSNYLDFYKPLFQKKDKPKKPIVLTK